MLLKMLQFLNLITDSVGSESRAEKIMKYSWWVNRQLFYVNNKVEKIHFCQTDM